MATQVASRRQQSTRRMTETLRTAWSIPDVRRRLLFVAWILVVYTGCVYVPLPGIDRTALEAFFSRAGGGGVLDLLNAFSGGALREFSVIALGIMPYINASIIFQLLTIAIPALERLQREEGEEGRKIIAKYIRWATVALAIIQATGLAVMLRSQGILSPGIMNLILVIITMTAGTSFLMWLGEELSEKGIGNGVSLLIFAGIMCSIPDQVGQTVAKLRVGAIQSQNVIGLILVLVAIVAFIIVIQQGQRRIEVNYASRVVGHRMYRGHSSYLPLKVNQAGVIPIIFAISVFMFPATLAQFLLSDSLARSIGVEPAVLQRIASKIVEFQPGVGLNGAIAAVIYFALVVVFTYFYTAVTFKPTEVAETLRKNGGTIPGRRPGTPTAKYLDQLLVRITLPGALFLGLIALTPYYVPLLTHVDTFNVVGGTSLLIVVGVTMDTMQGLEAHLLMRNYEGFIR